MAQIILFQRSEHTIQLPPRFGGILDMFRTVLHR